MLKWITLRGGTLADPVVARSAQPRHQHHLLDTLPVVVWECSVDDLRFTYVNGAAEKMLGYSISSWLSDGFLQTLVHPDDRRRVSEALREAAASDSGGEIELRALASDGRVLRLAANIASVRDAEGKRRLHGTLRDITDTHRREEQLLERLRIAENARADADSINRQKDEFLAMLSHELRAPLGSILIWTQLLRTGGLDEPSIKRALGMIERSTETLEHFISDLLDISRIIAGKFSIESRPVELPSVVDAAVEAAQPAAQAKNVRIISAVDRSVPRTSGDAARLQQVLGNLLSNAIKFTTDEGTVQVTLDRVDDRARIQVCDTGIGIPRDFLPNVFDRFRQADSTSSRTHRGLGLGLAIVRHLVELHGGAVAAESPGVGLGSTFTVFLPLLAEESEAAPIEPPESSEAWVLDSSALAGVRILLLDDEEDARESLRVLLERSGATVAAVGSVAEALARIEDFRPGVILSDIAMPEEDGYRFIRRVRALPADSGRDTPAAALTAYASREDRRNALLAGYQEHIPKPPDPARLISLISRLAR
jgi:PAS domain S-box-containing protein